MQQPPREIPWAEFFGDVQPLWGEPTAQTHELEEVIGQLLGGLEADERDILLMHVNGLSIRDIATAMGIGKTTVHNKLPAIMGKVAELLKTNPEVTEWMSGENHET